MTQELTALWTSLQDAEYLHLLLEHLPLYGIAAGLVFLIGSLALRDHKMRLLALALVIACCASVKPYLELRTKSEPRIIALQPQTYHALIQQQTARRASSAWLYYGIGAWCGFALWTMRKNAGITSASVTIGLCLIGVVHATWLHRKEAEIFHRNVVKFTPVK